MNSLLILKNPIVRKTAIIFVLKYLEPLVKRMQQRLFSQSNN